MRIFAHVHELLEYARTLGFERILVRGRPNLCGLSTTLHFVQKAPRFATLFIALKNCFFSGASFEPIKSLATLSTLKLQDFHGTPLYYCYTLIAANLVSSDLIVSYSSS